jgi:hypothetical protein
VDKESLIQDLKSRFSDKAAIPKEQLIDFLKLFYADAKQSTLDWRLHELSRDGVLIRTGWGYYALNTRRQFSPSLPKDLRWIGDQIKAELPYTDYCVWDTRVLADLMIQQPVNFIQLVEVERIAVSSTHNLLQNRGAISEGNLGTIYVYEDWMTLSHHIASTNNPIIIRPLVGEAPLQQEKQYKTASLEKIIVDIIADQDLFHAFQEELAYIVKSAFEKYVINRDKLRRYARRRNKIEQIDSFLFQLPPNYQPYDS